MQSNLKFSSSKCSPIKKTFCVIALAGFAALTSGCASTYGNMVSGSNLGAQEYQPAVLPNPGQEERYKQVLGVCRTVAVNRNITAAQEAQLKTITGAVSGTTSGAAFGMKFGSIMKQAGLNSSINRNVGIGAAAGLISSLGNSFASGISHTADETKRILLSCLRSADPKREIYTVIE